MCVQSRKNKYSPKLSNNWRCEAQIELQNCRALWCCWLVFIFIDVKIHSYAWIHKCYF